MSNIRWVGKPQIDCHERVRRGASKELAKKKRWGYRPKRKDPIEWVEVGMYIQASLVTFVSVVVMFLVWFHAGR